MKLTEKVFEKYMFFVTESKFEFKIHNDKFEAGELIVDVDFDTYTGQDDRGRVDLVIILDPKKGDSGYKIYIEAQGFFKLSKDITKSKKKIDDYLMYTCLPMVISSLRAYIKITSTYMPLGSYTLPAISLDELFKMKAETVKESNKG